MVEGSGLGGLAPRQPHCWNGRQDSRLFTVKRVLSFAARRPLGWGLAQSRHFSPTRFPIHWIWNPRLFYRSYLLETDIIYLKLSRFSSFSPHNFVRFSVSLIGIHSMFWENSQVQKIKYLKGERSKERESKRDRQGLERRITEREIVWKRIKWSNKIVFVTCFVNCKL